MASRDLEISAPSEGVQQFNARIKSSRQDFIACLRAIPALAKVVAELDGRQTYLIEWPSKAVDALRSGVGVWKQASDGTFEAAIRAKEGGGFVKHLRLRETQAASVDLSALSNIAMQSALAEIICRIERVEATVGAIRAGQQNDRHGQVDAGEDMYLQALGVRNPENRRHLLHASVMPLVEGRAKLLRHVSWQASVLSKPDGGAPLFGETPSQKLATAFAEIFADVGAAMRATRILALVHEELGEPDAAREAVRQFAEGIGDSASKLKELARYVPYSPSTDHEKLWSQMTEQLLPAAQAVVATKVLKDVDERLVFEFTPGEFSERDA